MEPVLKWAGGKRLLIPEIISLINMDDLKKHRYYEPFIGGGAVCFHLSPQNAVINDCNFELINVYMQIRDNSDELIKLLKDHKDNHSLEHYERVRFWDREDNFENLDPLLRAARTIYLNKTCYNGLYRVNSLGHFNVPMGKYKNPDIVNEKKIKKLSHYLKNNKVEIRNEDFATSVKDAKDGDIIYFDPPYDYEEVGFTSYNSNGFSKSDLNRLKQTCDDLISRGCQIIVSNNNTKFVDDLFSSNLYTIKYIEANRFINCDGSKRQKVKEVIIYGRE